jgi:DNA-binding IclR family transcriptional regulator
MRIWPASAGRSDAQDHHGPRAAQARDCRRRKSGIAYDDGEYNAEARCVAVPVKDFTGEVRVAIGNLGRRLAPFPTST